MTEPEGDSQAISVAELLARNGQRVGAGGGGRRRRGIKGGISVAELTGEFPAVRSGRAAAADDADEHDAPAEKAPAEQDTVVEQDTVAEQNAAEQTAADEKKAADDKAAADKAAADKAAADKSAAEQKAADDKAAADKAAEARKSAEAKKAADEKAAAARKAAEQKAGEQKADQQKAEERRAEERKAQADTPTVAATAVTAVIPAPTGPTAETTVIPQVSALAHSGEPEPKLLAGQTVAGDLLRQGGDTSGPQALRQDAVDTDDDLVDPEPESGNGKQWAVLLGQGAVALVAGALMFKGFEKLWDMLPMVGLVLAVLVIVGLVAMVRILRRTDDIASLVIAVVAGVFVTLGPLAFLLSTS